MYKKMYHLFYLCMIDGHLNVYFSFTSLKNNELNSTAQLTERFGTQARDEFELIQTSCGFNRSI